MARNTRARNTADVADTGAGPALVADSNLAQFGAAQLTLGDGSEAPDDADANWGDVTGDAGGPVFARHGTFAPRSGWLKKGYDAARGDPDVFAREAAPVVLGVGKNMVRAIRYWCHAFGVLRDVPGARGGSRPTAFGDALLGDRGLDPYLEDPGSLWRLHWRLLREQGLATAWRFAFFEFPRPEFTAENLTEALAGYAAREYPGARSAALSSLRKDASCITRMYGAPDEDAVGAVVTSEEALRCPFAALGLLQPAPQRRAFTFHVGPKPGLSSHIVAAACLEVIAARPHDARTASVASLARGPGAPGLAFRLGEAALYAALDEAAADEPALTLADAGGVVQLSVRGDPAAAADRCTVRHYEKAGRVSTAAWGALPNPDFTLHGM